MPAQRGRETLERPYSIFMVMTMQFMLYLTYHRKKFSVSKIANFDICTSKLTHIQYRNNLKRRSTREREQVLLQHAWFSCCVAEFCANEQSAYLLTGDLMQLKRLTRHEVAKGLSDKTGAHVSTTTRWIKAFQVTVLFEKKIVPCAELMVKSSQVERARGCYMAINALLNEGITLQKMTNDMVYSWLCANHQYVHSRRATNEEFQRVKFNMLLDSLE